jgi:hypothetical protein
MTTPISAGTLTSLRGAMARLLANRSEHTDGRLTVANLAREAGVCRATANRAQTVLNEFRTALGERRRAPVARSSRARIKELEAEVTLLRGQERQDARQLRQAVQIMAQQIQALALGAVTLMRHSPEAADEAGKNASGNVVPIRPVS